MKLKEMFNIKNNTYQEEHQLFEDKNMLEQIRVEILSSIINGSLQGYSTINDFIIEKIETIVARYNLNENQKDYIRNMIDNEFQGYGPLTNLMNDNKITSIKIIGPNQVYVEVDNNYILDKTTTFINEAHIIRTVNKMLLEVNTEVNKNNLSININLKDGTKISGLFKPLALNDSIVVIRKRNKAIASLDEMLKNGVMTPYMARYLSASVKANLNILIIGDKLSGKTTLVNACLNEIEEDSTLLIDKEYEATTNKANIVSINPLEIDDNLIDTVRSLNMDRVAFSSLDNESVLNYLEMLSMGELGVIASYYANDLDDLLTRIYAYTKNKYTKEEVNNLFLKHIDLVVNIKKFPDGKRRIVNISEVTMDKENIMFKVIFDYKLNKKNYEFVLYNFKPNTYKKMLSRGVIDLKDIFK
jgi:pilus assembly protein CpaF